MALLTDKERALVRKIEIEAVRAGQKFNSANTDWTDGQIKEKVAKLKEILERREASGPIEKSEQNRVKRVFDILDEIERNRFFQSVQQQQTQSQKPPKKQPKEVDFLTADAYPKPPPSSKKKSTPKESFGLPKSVILALQKREEKLNSEIRKLVALSKAHQKGEQAKGELQALERRKKNVEYVITSAMALEQEQRQANKTEPEFVKRIKEPLAEAQTQLADIKMAMEKAQQTIRNTNKNAEKLKKLALQVTSYSNKIAQEQLREAGFILNAKGGVKAFQQHPSYVNIKNLADKVRSNATKVKSIFQIEAPVMQFKLTVDTKAPTNFLDSLLLIDTKKKYQEAVAKGAGFLGKMTGRRDAKNADREIRLTEIQHRKNQIKTLPRSSDEEKAQALYTLLREHYDKTGFGSALGKVLKQEMAEIKKEFKNADKVLDLSSKNSLNR